MNSLTARLVKAAHYVAALLLVGWVLHQVHWADFVVDAQGSYAVLDARPSRSAPVEIQIATGGWLSRESSWQPAARFSSLTGAPGLIRPGFYSCLKGLGTGYMALALLSFFASILFLALRWEILLRVQRVSLPRASVLKLTFLGDFLNNVLPGIVGGELAKAYLAVRQGAPAAPVLMSLSIDRVLGLAGLAGQAALMLPVLLSVKQVDPAVSRLILISLGVTFVLVLVALTFVFSRRLRSWIPIPGWIAGSRAGGFLQALFTSADLYAERPGYLVMSITLTALSQITWVGTVVMIGFALDLENVGWTDYFVYVPMIFIIAAVPVTPGGAGLLEQLHLFFFAAAGNPSKILAMVLLYRLVTLVCGLPGLPVLLATPQLPDDATVRRELDGQVSKNFS